MAFEPIAVVWPEERILHLDERLLVIDKPRGLPVHGGTPEFDDVVTRLARWLRQRGEDDYLSVHSRLDKDVSGVMVFGRRPSDNRAIAQEFEAHRVIKRYVAVVADPGLPDRFEMHDRLQPSERGPTRVVSAGGVEASTQGFVRTRSNGRAWVELYPRTGRRHQLRAQLAKRNAPICGDALYGGARAPRLMLHAVAIASKALGWDFASAVPDGFGAAEPWSSRGLTQALFDAAWLREPLLRSTDAMRLVNSESDGVPGVTVDRFGDWAVVELFSEDAIARKQEICEIVQRWGARGVYAKIRMRRDLRHEDVEDLAQSAPVIGEPAKEAFVVREFGVPAEVRLGDGWDVGIYLDQRDNRRRIRAAAKDASVLNLFAYTATFSVAAALGGARQVVTVDLSGRALDRARRNYELAGIEVDERHRFIRADAVDWLTRAARSQQVFDLVILDPPSFSTVGRGKVFRLADAWDSLLTAVFRLLSPRGQLLVISHERAATQTALRRRVQRAAERAGRRDPAVRDLNSPVDFPPAYDGPWPSFGFWVAPRQR